jgi:tetratricopeptide (TPR) repeat protein
LVSQIVIVDTGSIDNTIEISRGFGATVVDFFWNDPYAEARNAALAPMSTDWVLVLDADEELSGDATNAIRDLVQRAETFVGGYSLPIRNYVRSPVVSVAGTIAAANVDDVKRAKDARAWSEHRLCRLFRRHPDVYFSGRIHEGVEQRIHDAGFSCPEAEARILHFGHLEAKEENHRKKQEHYRKLLRLAVKDTPHYPHLWIQLALCELNYADDTDAALECVQRAVALNPLQYDGWTLLAELQTKQSQYEHAIHSLGNLPDTGELGTTKAWSLGDLFYNLGRFPEAQTMYARALEHVKPGHGNPTIEFKSSIESRLGATEVQLGMHEAGFGRLHRAVGAAPLVLENHNRLMRAYVLVKNDRCAADAAEATLQHIWSEQLYRRAVALRVRLKEVDRARNLIDSGLRLFPQSEELHRMKMEVGFSGQSGV